MASVISRASAPLSRAIAVVACKQGWQLAKIDAPTAINALIRSSLMVHLSFLPL